MNIEGLASDLYVPTWAKELLVEGLARQNWPAPGIPIDKRAASVLVLFKFETLGQSKRKGPGRVGWLGPPGTDFRLGDSSR